MTPCAGKRILWLSGNIRESKMVAKPQLRYLAAVALVDTIRPFAADAVKALGLSDDDDSDARYQAEIDAEDALGYTAALTEKAAAKKALIEWGHTQAASIPGYAANKADLDNLFTNWFRYPRIADKLVETILRLDARS